jgi:hypothetical protein
LAGSRRAMVMDRPASRAGKFMAGLSQTEGLPVVNSNIGIGGDGMDLTWRTAA